MVLIFTLAVATATFHFDGGSDAELVEAVASQLKAPVALLVQEVRRWPAVKFDREPADRMELLRVLAAKLGLERPVENSLGLSAKGWPSEFYFTQHRGRYLLKPVGDPGAKRNADGTQSVATDDRPALLASIFAAVSKPVKWHWFFEGAVLAVHADHVSESEYVKLIARSLGAKVRDTGTEYYLDFDPAIYRSRGIAVLEDLVRKKAEDILNVQDYLYTIEVLKWFSDKELAAAMMNEAKYTFRTEVMPKPIAEAALARLRRHFPVEDDGTAWHPSTVAVWERLKQRGDFEHMTVVFMPKGSSACQIPAKNKGGPDTVF